MLDTVLGSVTGVIDGDTFDMHVERVGNHNKYDYNATERIRIYSFNAPELNQPGGKRSKLRLERRLLNHDIQCAVKTRDEYRRLVAEVTILN